MLKNFIGGNACKGKGKGELRKWAETGIREGKGKKDHWVGRGSSCRKLQYSPKQGSSQPMGSMQPTLPVEGVPFLTRMDLQLRPALLEWHSLTQLWPVQLYYWWLR